MGFAGGIERQTRVSQC